MVENDERIGEEWSEGEDRETISIRMGWEMVQKDVVQMENGCIPSFMLAYSIVFIPSQFLVGLLPPIGSVCVHCKRERERESRFTWGVERVRVNSSQELPFFSHSFL